MSVHVLPLHPEVEEGALVEPESGSSTLEYAVLLAVVCAMAGVLLLIVQSNEINKWLLDIVKSAFDMFR